MPDVRRYSEAEFRERLAVRKERIDAAVATGMLIHQEGRQIVMNARAKRLPDGRIALDPDDFNKMLSELGRVTGPVYLESVLRAVFDEQSG